MEGLAVRQRDAGRSLLNLPELAWKSLSRAVRAGSEIAKHLFAFKVRILLAMNANLLAAACGLTKRDVLAHLSGNSTSPPTEWIQVAQGVTRTTSPERNLN